MFFFLFLVFVFEFLSMWHSFMAKSLQKLPSSNVMYVKLLQTTNISIHNLLIWCVVISMQSDEETALFNRLERPKQMREANETKAQNEYGNTECVINLIFMFLIHAISMPWICIHNIKYIHIAHAERCTHLKCIILSLSFTSHFPSCLWLKFHHYEYIH